MNKRVLGLLLALILCLPGVVANAAAKTSADFTDLKDLDAATKAKFDALIAAGVFNGVGEDKFGLKEEMNRAQFAKVAALIFDLKVDGDQKTSSFKDVKSDDAANGYALPYIEAVKAAGITDGYGNGVFNPAGKVTKEQLATFLIRGLGKKEDAKDTPGVNDSTVSDWAKGYVALALELKLLANGADGKFGGQSNATRDLLVLGAYEAKQQYVPPVKPETKPDPKPETSTPSRTLPATVTVAKPAANPVGGEVAAGTAVSLSTATVDAVIHYTTDGSTPTVSSAVYSTAISITSPVTIKAIAVKSGATDSEIMSESYTVIQPVLDVVAKPTASQAGGEVAAGTLVTLNTATPNAEIHYTTDGSTPTESSPVYSTAICIESPVTIKAIAVKLGATNSEVMSESYTISPPVLEFVAKPVASITGGEVMLGTPVTLSTATPDAVIYYTIDGSTPTTSSPIYSAAISVISPVTIKAIAVKPGAFDSEIMSENYTVMMFPPILPGGPCVPPFLPGGPCVPPIPPMPIVP
ncbi:chitobiase/beta-hexosaminidase C-terminal domain-containing protein [Paenibacillus sp. MMS18-CY102]|uniref:chitobiase/beta-hexosaminidase C-terminal domain-containing protein n=1 Tax=Paenibacillus sp. MMS18-CY102 TaxID=2682849 RepID=UPI001365352C|nr:chitobiase/beta-hexosaminidase C-terminal domain-containing protein [Paenibacillus sp. MMS18-CY102]MWC30724.1 hypothetical protein [Paenibacillus sp. MMS18-CY102]